MTFAERRQKGLLLLGAGLLVFLGFARPGVSAPDEKLDVVISRAGFHPSEIRVRKGETLHLSITTADEEHCFAVDELRIEKRVMPQRASRVAVTPDRPGRFDVYCCLEPGDKAQRGTLVVTE